MKVKEWLKKIDWILLFYVIGFTAGLVVTATADYEGVKNIMFVWGIISAYIFIFIFRDREVKE